MAAPRTRRLDAGETAMRWWSFAALALGGGVLLFITLFILREAWPALSAPGGMGALLYGDPWTPLGEPPRFGILHAWVSTFLITGIALLLATPFAFGVGLFLAEVAPAPARLVLRPCLDLLAGIPSVVYGFFGYVALLPWFEARFGMATGESVLAAGLILAIMILPFIASTATEAFQMVPREVREAAMAQGITRWYMVRRVVIPHAASGMFAGVALGLARAIGETLAVLMLAGNSVAVPHGVLDRGQPLTALIATELGEAGVGSAQYHALFAAGATLMAVVIGINTLIWSWKGRLTRHERG